MTRTSLKFRGFPDALLGLYAAKHLTKTRQLLSEAGTPAPAGLEVHVGELLTRTLARILLSVKRAGHGGALLLIPKHSKTSLRIKHLVHYDKLDQILPVHVASEARVSLCDSIISERFIEASLEDFPPGTEISIQPQLAPALKDSFLRTLDADDPTAVNFQESMATCDRDDAVKGELGCVAFISALSRIDGLVLLSEGLTVRGFGVEITCRAEPPSVFVAGDAKASKGRLRPLNYTHYGTRHRSMMRYCYAHKDSIGFVISQDGDVRAMTRIGNSLIVWENIKLQEVEVVRSTAEKPDKMRE